MVWRGEHGELWGDGPGHRVYDVRVTGRRFSVEDEQQLRDDSYAGWTVGGLLYLSTTAGAITQTAPSGTDDVIQILGVAYASKIIFFNPQLVQVEHT